MDAKIHLKYHLCITISTFYSCSYSFFMLLCKRNKKIIVNLIIDIGNSSAKLAVFNHGEIIYFLRCSHDMLNNLSDLYEQYPITRGIVSSVVELSEDIQQILKNLPFPVVEFTYETPIPIKNLYESPKTLGMDRLAAAVAANMIYPNRQVLIIDAGTCITYDLIDELGQYHGGNISPGVDIRLKALQTFTGKLPLVSKEGEKPLLGKDTDTAIRSGVIRGIEYEMNGYLVELKKIYPSLLIFLTGGSEFSFDTKLKSSIFADVYLVLKGLNRILEYNG